MANANNTNGPSPASQQPGAAVSTGPLGPVVSMVTHSGKTWEDLVQDELFIRDCIKLLTEGWSYRSIGEWFGVEYRVMMQVARLMPTFVAEETRALAAVWQGAEYARIEDMKRRLLPHIAHDPTIPNQDAPNPKLIAAYVRLVVTELAVLTLNRGEMKLPDVPNADNSDEDKGARVTRYIALVESMQRGVLESGFGSGLPDGTEDDEEDELLRDGRADNSSSVESIDDAVVLDETLYTDEDLDSEPGTWVDGKWTTDATRSNAPNKENPT